MKHTISLIIVAFLFTTCFTSKSTTLEKETKVFKKVVEAMYSPKDKIPNRKTALKENISQITFYDKNGNVTEYHDYEVDGTLWRVSKITRNETGKPLKGITTNAKGEKLSYWETKLDEKGYVVEYKTYNQKGELTDVQQSKYDTDGNVIELILEALDYEYTNKTEFKYNSKNQLIERKHHNGAQNKTDIRTYKYDENENEIEELLTRADGSKLLFKNEYDENNNLISNIWYVDGKQTHETTFTYMYDENNNWITKKRYSKKELGLTWERKIEYY